MTVKETTADSSDSTNWTGALSKPERRISSVAHMLANSAMGNEFR
ncbi:MAG: hypothetical protein WCO85_03525 [Actinomycetes bacterium]